MWNTTGVPGSIDVVIEDNFISTHNSTSHGIYMGNASANNGPGPGKLLPGRVSTATPSFPVTDLGWSWGQTNHLEIHGNIVLHDPTLPTGNGVPSIRVNAGATDVSMTGNVTHRGAAPPDSNWQTKPTPPAGTSRATATSPLAAASRMRRPCSPRSMAVPRRLPKALAAFAADTDTLRQADTFSFDSHGKTDVARGLDFGAGDRIVLHDFAAGTFNAPVPSRPAARPWSSRASMG